MTCQRCGKCCSTQGSPPFFDQTQTGQLSLDALPPHLRTSYRRQRDTDPYRYDRGLPCFWWNPDTKLCKHYEHRPPICRDYPGGEPCINERSKGR